MAGVLGTQHSRSQRLAMGRCFWIVMAIVHAPALVGLWHALISEGAGSIRLSSFLGLNLATVLFVLKVWGVRLLEFEADRRSLIAITLAVALMHGNVIGAWSSCIAVPQEVPIAASILFASGLSRVQRALRRPFSCSRETWRTAKSFIQRVRLSAFHPRQLLLATRLCTPRAPPLSDVPA